jgi:uncharacterized protein YbcI
LNHVGFFLLLTKPEKNAMNYSTPTMAEQIAQAATAFQQQRTGRAPKSVNVVVSGDTLVITLQGALSPAEQLMAQSPEGAAKVAEFHRELFQSASDTLRAEIKRITKVDVRQADADVEPNKGAVVQVFPTGTMVQVFLLTHPLPSHAWSGDGSGDPD